MGHVGPRLARSRRQIANQDSRPHRPGHPAGPAGARYRRRQAHRRRILTRDQGLTACPGRSVEAHRQPRNAGGARTGHRIWIPVTGLAAAIGVAALMIGTIIARRKAGQSWAGEVAADTIVLLIAAAAAWPLSTHWQSDRPRRRRTDVSTNPYARNNRFDVTTRRQPVLAIPRPSPSSCPAATAFAARARAYGRPRTAVFTARHSGPGTLLTPGIVRPAAAIAARRPPSGLPTPADRAIRISSHVPPSQTRLASSGHAHQPAAGPEHVGRSDQGLRPASQSWCTDPRERRVPRPRPCPPR